MLLLFGRTVGALPQLARQREKVYLQLFEIGNASLVMACVLSLFIGGVTALHTGTELAARGLSGVIGGVVGLSVCKELAPTLMSILIAGRIGSAMTAEIGSMQVYQEVDALRTMNINPVHYLVLPRLVAMAVGLPLLVVFSILVAWMGGAFVSVYNRRIGLTFTAFFTNLKQAVEVGDVLGGLFKSWVFALVICIVACYQGLATSGGPRGIGQAVTRSVVQAIVLILILDYFLTRLLLHFNL